MSRFIHPQHAKGVRSFWPVGHDNGSLTDRKIARYIKLGHYTNAMQRAALERPVQRQRSARRGTSLRETYSLEDLLP